MNQTTSIIVYRNPMEQAVWEGLMNFENLLPIFAGVFVFVATFALLNHLADKQYRPRWQKPVLVDYAIWAISFATTFLVVKYLWI